MYSWTAGGVRSQSMGQKGSAHRIESVCAWEAGGCITRVPADVGFLLCVLSASSPQNSSEGGRTHTMRAPCERIPSNLSIGHNLACYHRQSARLRADVTGIMTRCAPSHNP